MKNIFKIIAVCVVAMCSICRASEDNRPTYKFFLNYPLVTPFKYSCIEQSQVKRGIKDAKGYEFERTAALHFTMMLKDMPNEGISRYMIRTDSINHSITRDAVTKQFDTNNGDMVHNWNDDLEQYSIPMSQEFEYIISPYYEYAGIVADEGRQKQINSLDSTGKTMKKTDYCMWKNSLSDDRLYHVTDVKKIEFPYGRLPVDTVWRSPIEFQISGVTIFDSVEVKFVDERGRYKFLEATFKAEKFAKDPVVIYGFRDQIAEPQKVNLDCTFKMELSPASTVENTTITAVGTVEFKLDDGRIVTDTVDTKLTWVKLGQYEY